MEAGVGIEPTDKSFAGSCITTLLPSHFEMEIFSKTKKSQSKKQFQDYKFFTYKKFKSKNAASIYKK